MQILFKNGQLYSIFVFNVTPLEYRWQDLVLTIWWMYDNAPNNQQAFLLELAQEIHRQGFDWNSFYVGPNFPKVGSFHGSLLDLCKRVNVMAAARV